VSWDLNLDALYVTTPGLFLLGAGAVFLSWPPTLFGWFSCGLVAILGTRFIDQSSVLDASIVVWPRPETRADFAVNAIAYNGVLVISTALSQLVWDLSRELAFAAVAAGFLPLWFLEHLSFLAFFGES
jgi:hypothetical protein